MDILILWAGIILAVTVGGVLWTELPRLRRMVGHANGIYKLLGDKSPAAEVERNRLMWLCLQELKDAVLLFWKRTLRPMAQG